MFEKHETKLDNVVEVIIDRTGKSITNEIPIGYNAANVTNMLADLLKQLNEPQKVRLYGMARFIALNEGFVAPLYVFVDNIGDPIFKTFVDPLRTIYDEAYALDRMSKSRKADPVILNTAYQKCLMTAISRVSGLLSMAQNVDGGGTKT